MMKHKNQMLLQKWVLIVAFLIVPLALLATFSLYPAIKLLFLSFTSWDGLSQSYPWVGLTNYFTIFKNPQLFSAFGHNFSYFIGGIVQNIVALYFATLLNTKLKGRNLFRSILFLPYILNAVAIVFIFKFIYQDQGALDILLQHIGLGGLQQDWIGNDSIVNWSLAFVSLWEFFGFNMVIYLAALQSIPEELYEAAAMDGAGRFKSFFYITIPNLRAIIQINMLLTVSGALESFNIPFIMTNASPPSATFLTNTMNVAFTFNNYGLASAMAIVLLIIVCIVLVIQQRLIGGAKDIV